MFRYVAAACVPQICELLAGPRVVVMVVSLKSTITCCSTQVPFRLLKVSCPSLFSPVCSKVDKFGRRRDSYALLGQRNGKNNLSSCTEGSATKPSVGLQE